MATYERDHENKDFGTTELCANRKKYVLPHRTAEAIKGARNKSAVYKDVL